MSQRIIRWGKGLFIKLPAVITKENKWYVAHCIELGVVSQGSTDDLPEGKGEIILYPLEVAIGG